MFEIGKVYVKHEALLFFTGEQITNNPINKRRHINKNVGEFT